MTENYMDESPKTDALFAVLKLLLYILQEYIISVSFPVQTSKNSHKKTRNCTANSNWTYLKLNLNFKILKREIVQQDTFIGELNSMVRQLRDPEQETAESPVAESKENIHSNFS